MRQEIPDLYAVLGVAPTATQDQIKSAFRRRSKQCHPDAGGTQEAMVELLQAYEILSDPELRRQYDAFRQDPDNPKWWGEYESAGRSARDAYAAYGQTWEELVRWVEGRSGQIQSTASGRVASSAVGGGVLGAAAGAGFGWFFGIEWWMGLILGAALGLISGGMVARSRESEASEVVDAK